MGTGRYCRSGRHRGGGKHGGGGGGGGSNNSADPDTTAPNAPSGLKFSSDGKTVTGTAEPGSTITLKDANGNVIGTGKTGSDGNFSVSLGTPLTNGEQVTATATDNAGNTSQGSTSPHRISPHPMRQRLAA
jgi:hypothetical protein